MNSASRFHLHKAELAAMSAAEDVSRTFNQSIEHDGPFTRDELLSLFQTLGPLGYLSSILPKSDGAGAGVGAEETENSVLTFAAMVEGLSPELPLLGNHSVQRYLHAYGNADQKARYLPPLLSGDSIASIAISEPGVGGDLRTMATVADRVDGGYVLNGTKHWVTHGPVADLFVVLARTQIGATRFLIPRDMNGLTVMPMDTIGLRRLGFAKLEFSDCRIPADSLFGSEGGGLEGAKAAFPIARLLAGLQAIRLGEAAVDLALEMASDRTVFGRRLIEVETIADRAAEYQAQAQAARLLCYQGLVSLEEVGSAGRASIAKAVSTEWAQAAACWSRAVLGAAALECVHPINRLVADLDMMAVVDGTAALNRLVAGRRLQKRFSTDQ